MLTSTPMTRLLLTLPALAAAFLQPSITTHGRVINRNHLPSQDTIFTLKNSEDHHNVLILDEENEISCEINKLLIDRSQDLLSDSTKLEKEHPQSTVAADNENRNLTTKQMVHEALLSARMPLPFLNRTRVGPSLIEGAGRGLFATENIADGEVITCYPGDAILYELPSEDGTDDDLNDESEEGEYEEGDEYTETIVLWGAHVPQKDIWDEDAVFDGTESTPPLTAYAVSVDDSYSVLGNPALDKDPGYYGHFANDGAGHLALEKANSPANIAAVLELGLETDVDYDEEVGVEGNIIAYVFKSIEVSNAMHKTIGEDGLHVATVATRDIEAGEEILVTYGPDYWIGYA